MRIAVLADIHANLPALDACLTDAARERCDEVWVLGDVIGRGPHPHSCVERVRRECTVVLAGNHDRVCAGLDPFDWLGPDAPIARWTHAQLTIEQRQWIESLTPAAVRHHLLMMHGGPADPLWQFVSTVSDAQMCFSVLKARWILVGHTHRPGMLRQEASGAISSGRTPDVAPLDRRRCILNPGAVGVPAGRDPRASWLLIDLAAAYVQWQRSAYSHALVRADLEVAGFPERALRPFAR